MPSRIPGAREIPDPVAETEHLAKARQPAPAREWGVRCATGTVKLCRTPAEASSVLAGAEGLPCGPHTLVYRDVPPWRKAPPPRTGARW